MSHPTAGHGQDTSHHYWEQMGDGKLRTEDADIGLGHILQFSTYFYVYFSLIMLTGITLWAAYQDFGVFNLFVAMGIATVKAGVVTLIFMHLNYESKIIWGIVIYPLFIFVLIICGTLGDSAVKFRAVPMTGKFQREAPVEPLHTAVVPNVRQPGPPAERAFPAERAAANHSAANHSAAAHTGSSHSVSNASASPGHEAEAATGAHGHE